MNVAWETYRKHSEHVAAIKRNAFRCMGCRKECLGGDYYMTHDDVWVDEAGLPPGGMTCPVTRRFVAVHCFLCVECLEQRLGRELTVDDLNDYPVNDALRARMRAFEGSPPC